jgi:hypothetical protein
MKTLILALLLPMMSFCAVDSSLVFKAVIEVSAKELCAFENLLYDEDLMDLYLFEMIQVDAPTSKMMIIHNDKVIGVIHGNVNSSFLQKIHSRIVETYNDHGKR